MARTVTVALGQHYEEFIQANIAGGRYNNASEVVRAALRRLEEDEARLAAFCAAVDEGDASPDVMDFDEEVFRDLKNNKDYRFEISESFRVALASPVFVNHLNDALKYGFFKYDIDFHNKCRKSDL